MTTCKAGLRPQEYVDPRCPYGPNHPAEHQQVLTEMRRIRQGMRDLGYDRVIAVHNAWSLAATDPIKHKDGRGKQPGSEPVVDEAGNKIIGPEGKIQCTNWRQHGHIDDFLNRRRLLLTNTGLVLGGVHNLAALDLDPNKGESDAERVRTALDILRELFGGAGGTQIRQGLIRVRYPGSVAIVVKTDRPITKYKVAGERGGIELLAEGQFLVVHGDHKDEADIGPGRSWLWQRGRGPWTVPVSQLPVVSAAEIIAELDRLRAAGVLGSPISTPNGGGHGGGRPFGTSDVMRRLHELEAEHNGLIRPAVRELIAEIGTFGHGRHDAHIRIVGYLNRTGWTAKEVDRFLTPLINHHFGDDDWSGEIALAYAHAQKREAERAAPPNTRTFEAEGSDGREGV